MPYFVKKKKKIAAVPFITIGKVLSLSLGTLWLATCSKDRRSDWQTYRANEEAKNSVEAS